MRVPIQAFPLEPQDKNDMTETEVEIRSHKESRASEVLKINSKL